MTKKEYIELTDAIKADSPYSFESEATEMAQCLIEDDSQLKKYLESIASDIVGRLASDLM